jgi:hypothetical protein
VTGVDVLTQPYFAINFVPSASILRYIGFRTSLFAAVCIDGQATDSSFHDFYISFMGTAVCNLPLMARQALGRGSARHVKLLSRNTTKWAY